MPVLGQEVPVPVLHTPLVDAAPEEGWENSVTQPTMERGTYQPRSARCIPLVHPESTRQALICVTTAFQLLHKSSLFCFAELVHFVHLSINLVLVFFYNSTYLMPLYGNRYVN